MYTHCTVSKCSKTEGTSNRKLSTSAPETHQAVSNPHFTIEQKVTATSSPLTPGSAPRTTPPSMQRGYVRWRCEPVHAGK